MTEEDKLSEESLLGDESTLYNISQASLYSRRRWKNHIYLYSSQLLFFSVSLTLFISALTRRSVSTSCTCGGYVPMYSPALEAVKDSSHSHRFDGSFATPNSFKGTPSPSIDEHWNDITYADGGVISISKDILQAVNASQYSVELAPEIGGGYMASIEALHQLHCLNMLRKATYEDYYKDKGAEWKDSPQILRYHLDHCIDNLRQKLMCDADAGVLTYVWAKGHPAPFPDFSVQHKCRDFSALKRWVVDHQLFTTAAHGIDRLPGALELDSPP